MISRYVPCKDEAKAEQRRNGGESEPFPKLCVGLFAIVMSNSGSSTGYCSCENDPSEV